MATVIRLARHGRKNSPFYRIVYCNEQAPRDGKFIEVLGNYHPFTKKVVVDTAKVLELQKKGARLSATVERLIKNI